MSDHTELIRKYLKDLIQDAEAQLSGSKSLLDFAARIRRNTAREVLQFIETLPKHNIAANDGDGRPGDVVPLVHVAAGTGPAGTASFH